MAGGIPARRFKEQRLFYAAVVPFCRLGKIFSERHSANEVAEKKPGDWFFSLPCVSGDRMGQCHLWLREATTILSPTQVKTGEPTQVLHKTV